MQGLEKAHGEGAYALRSFAEWVQPKLLWLGEGLSDPSHHQLPPCGYAKLCEALRSYARACGILRYLGYHCIRNAFKTRQNGLQADFRAWGRLPYVLAQKTAQNGSNRVLAGFMGFGGFCGLSEALAKP